MPRSKRAASSYSRAPYTKKRYVAKPTRYQLRISRPMNINRTIHSFKRNVDLGLLQGSVSNRYAAYTFALNNVPNSNEFTTLFDQFRITHVQMHFYVQYNPAELDSTAGVGAAAYPCLYICRDNDDSTAPTSINQLREHANVQTVILSPEKIFKFNIKPATLSNVYQSTVSNSYAPKWKEWIDCAAADTPYYGVKLGIENMTNSAQYVVVRASYWFQCRDLR